MIVVTPNAKNAYDGSFYANSPVTGNWEDFIINDLVAYIDRHYRTIRSRTGRGITGHSMGGFGAFRIAMRHPEKFAAVYMMSPYGLMIGDSLRSTKATADWRSAISVTKREDVLKAGFSADLRIALAAVYSPDLSSQPLFLDFPYRLVGDSLILVDSVAARWRDTPMAMVPSHAASLRRLAIEFDSGRQDGFPDIPVSVVRLDSLLTSMRIDHVAELYEGTHVGGIRARLETKVLPFFSKNLH
jgi:pimeloyl-ACP methyl ester carboxylesterase